jgi:hypothetical protein
MNSSSPKNPAKSKPPHNSNVAAQRCLTKADVLEDRKMGPLTRGFRCARKLRFSSLLLVSTFTLGTTLGFAAGPNAETIQATYAQAGSMIGITLTIDRYSAPSDMQVLSQAFQDDQDRGLATALSKTNAAGHCSITGALGYDVAFIQTVLTPTGRQITFIAIRPLQSGETTADASSQSFDLAVGQFDLNDADNSKSTGFLYPASKLVIDKQGEFHYDLAGIPWSLVNVLDSREPPGETIALGPQASLLRPEKPQPPTALQPATPAARPEF